MASKKNNTPHFVVSKEIEVTLRAVSHPAISNFKNEFSIKIGCRKLCIGSRTEKKFCFLSSKI